MLAMLTLPSCGKKQPPNPNPAPPTTNPNPGGFSPVAGGCASVGPTSQPLSSFPYASNLTRFNNGYGYGQGGANAHTNTLNDLRIFFTNYARAEDPEKSIVANATFSFPDLLSGGGGQYIPPNLQYNFCVSSGNFNGAPSPGIFDQRYNSVSMTLRGIVSVPLYSQYSGYPGGYSGNPGVGQFGQELVTIDFGNYCPAVLSNGRLRCADYQCPCVEITIGGPQGVTFPYRAN